MPLELLGGVWYNEIQMICYKGVGVWKTLL